VIVGDFRYFSRLNQQLVTFENVLPQEAVETENISTLRKRFGTFLDERFTDWK